jgi:metallophosphoesterase (TIGR03767 family)
MGNNWGRGISRRAFIGGSVGAAAGAALWTPDLWTPARASALRAMTTTVVDPAGTTLESTIVLGTGGGYVALAEGPGWPTIERTELGSLTPGRVDARTAIAAIVQLTDVHVVDAQSPGRVEFLDRYGDPYTGAFRPQETLTTQVQTSMVTRINQVARGPITGRALDCAVSTGDNVDNQQTNELEWFMAVLNGGTVRANSGSPAGYEGVQAADWDDPSYWHPDPGAPSGEYDTKGFPRIPGLLEAATAPFASDGLNIAWYSCYGNHDGLIQGNLPTSATADQLFVGDRKIADLPPGMTALQFVGGMFTQIESVVAGLDAGTTPSRTVTPDERRRTIKTAEWVQAHLDRPGKVGPPGHGYDESHLDAPALYYSFEIAPGVIGISLDTGGYNSGSIGQIQIDWLEQELAAAHSSAFDPTGAPSKPGGTDQLVLLFSHFTIGTMNGSVPDPQRPDEKRYQAAELVAFLQRWPNIVGWVNGHTHTNTVTPVPDPSGRTNGFWEITTASHVDYPEQARIIELVDNGDGTISLLCTMLEHAAPITPDLDDTSMLGLASISRELSANDLGVDPLAHLGPIDALNVELALPAPFDLAAAGITGAAATSGSTPPGSTDGALPTTGADTGGSAGVLVGVGALAVVGAVAAGAVALRRRGTAGVDDDATPPAT